MGNLADNSTWNADVIFVIEAVDLQQEKLAFFMSMCLFCQVWVVLILFNQLESEQQKLALICVDCKDLPLYFVWSNTESVLDLVDQNRP